MKSISLQDHINQSKIAAAANRAKGNRHGQILSMLYADPYHFIEELLQNAEDALARQKDSALIGIVKIIITGTDISFYHNGDPFNEIDLMAITTFASTTKKGLPNINQIGKFGIGFRSVYGISDNPEIHSETHNYKITDFEVLENCPAKNTHEFSTLIFLPYKKSLTADFKTALENNLLNLNPMFLLFLKRIQQIEIVTRDSSTILSVETELVGKDLVRKKIIETHNGIRSIASYLVFNNIKSQKRESAIAFKIENGKFHPLIQPYVSVYFPTKYKLSHSVLVHANFTTTPNRENIPFSKEWTPENDIILNDLSELLNKTLKTLLKAKLISADFWKLFLWEQSFSDPISATISNSLNKFINKEKCFPDHNENMQVVSDLCLCEDYDLMHLLIKKDIVDIYGRLGFLHKDIAAIDNLVIHLKKNYKLKTADIDSFAFHIANHKEFLQKKPISYFYNFYRFLAKYPRLWDKTHKSRYYNLRNKSFIADKSKKIITPFSENDKPLIFIGKAPSDFSVVHPDLASNLDCINFFSMLGIPNFAPGLAETDTLFRRFKENNSSNWWYNLYKLYIASQTDIKEYIREKISKAKLLPCKDSNSGEKFFTTTSNAYIANQYLLDFFSFNRVLYVCPKLLSYISKQNIPIRDFEVFLTEIGVNNTLKFIEIDAAFDDERKKALRENLDFTPIVREKIIDLTIDGLESFLKHPTPKASKALWILLGKTEKKYQKASYTFESYVRSETVFFTPYYIDKLKHEAWMYDEFLNPVSPNGIGFEQLHAGFTDPMPESLWMADELGLNIKSISPEEKNILSFIRKNKISTDLLRSLVNQEKNDFAFLQYIPLMDDLNIPRENEKNAIGQMQMFTDPKIFPQTCALNWNQYFFEEKTQILKNHLLNTSLSNSKQINPFIKEPGHLQLKNDTIVLTHYFIGIRPDAGEIILLPTSFIGHYNERPDRQDTGLYVFNLSDNTCVEVSPQYFCNFIKTSKFSFINPIKLIND